MVCCSPSGLSKNQTIFWSPTVQQVSSAGNQVLGLGNKITFIQDLENVDIDDIFLLDRDNNHTAEINVRPASQSAVFNLHVKVHAHFLLQGIVSATSVLW